MQSYGNLFRFLSSDTTGSTTGEPKFEADAAGMLAVRNGNIEVYPPRGHGSYPVVRPGNRVRLWVNDEKVEKMCLITPTDSVRVEVPKEPPRLEMKVKISPDRLRACISVDAQPGRIFRLTDHFPGPDITLTAQPTTEGPPMPPTVTELKNLLAEHGVVFGVSEVALERIVDKIAKTKDRWKEDVEVAEGIPPREPVDERLETLFHATEKVRVDPKQDKTDLLNLYRLSTVKPGSVLAIVHPGRAGRPGRAVDGTQIPVGEPRSVRIRAGQGARWHPEEGRLLATIGGRPTFVNDTVSVLPKHVVAGDVDAKTGHIDFHGDVEVFGNVGDSIRIAADGALTVHGNVTNARLQGDESIIVGGNIVKAKVVAGAASARFLEIIALLHPLTRELQALCNGVAQLRAAARGSNAVLRDAKDGQLAKLLLERKFTHVVPRVRRLRQLTFSGPGAWLGNGFIQFVLTLHRCLVGLGPVSVKDAGEIDALRAACHEFLEILFTRQGQTPGFDVTSCHIHNAEVWASGEIVLRRGGCFYSTLHAGKGVHMESGVMRGHKVTAKGGPVVLNEVGSPLGAEVHIEIVSEEGRFQAGKVHPGVTVSIAGQTYTFQTEARDVHARHRDERLHVFAGTRLLSQPGGMQKGLGSATAKSI